MRTFRLLRNFGLAQRARETVHDRPRALRKLDWRNAAAAPARSGVYFLYRRARLVFVGLAPRGASIRSELTRYLEAALAEPLEFDCIAVDDPMPLYRTCMLRYVEAHDGRLPEWNQAALSRRPAS